MSVTLASAVLTALFFYFNLLGSWQEKIIDQFFLKKIPPSEIVIIGIDEDSIGQIGQWPWPRHIFADILEQIPHPRIVGIDVNLSETSRIGAADDASFAQSLRKAPYPIVLPVSINERGRVIFEPIPEFKSIVTLGFVNVPVDYDGIARRTTRSNGDTPSFAYALAGKESGAPEHFRIDYQGPEKTFLTVSFSDVLQKKIPARILEDKIILIGSVAPSLHDTIQTPFGFMPGVEFHANVINTIRTGRFYQEPNLLFGFLAIILLHAVLFGCVWLSRRFWILASGLAGTLVVLIAASLILFNVHIVAPIFYLLFGYLVSVILMLGFQYMNESKEKRFIRQTFQYYLSPDVIEQLVEDPQKVSLGGESKMITVLFSDIRGFTSISEKMTPQELVSFLNEYLTAMTDIVMASRGVVDKYIGDAVMAFWGAPLANVSQAKDSCATAVEMIRALRKLNDGWEKRGLPEIRIGIGINRGEMAVGNMGSNKRFNYTLMGDDVNLASRLEGLTKYYGVQCIISEMVRREIEANQEFFIRELDSVMVKGKKEPARIFELITQLPDNAGKEALVSYNRGKEYYNNGEWDNAIEKFQDAIKLSGDGPSKLFLSRCEEFKGNPPVNWNGVYEFKTK